MFDHVDCDNKLLTYLRRFRCVVVGIDVIVDDSRCRVKTARRRLIHNKNNCIICSVRFPLFTTIQSNSVRFSPIQWDSHFVYVFIVLNINFIHNTNNYFIWSIRFRLFTPIQSDSVRFPSDSINSHTPR